jgi:hypothetical protein
VKTAILSDGLQLVRLFVQLGRRAGQDELSI